MAIIKRMMSSVDYSKLQSWSEQDPDKFDKQKENELLIAKDFNEGDFTIIGTTEYYSKVKDGDFNKLSEKEIVELDEERKAHMVSNLLVVLCGNHDAQPIINSGTLY